MSTRPSYNNSRVNTESNSARAYSNAESYRSAPSRNNESTRQTRSSSS
jgi:hypothetical protein